MTLAEYIKANKQRLIDRWKDRVVERLSLSLEESELIDHLPELIDEMIDTIDRSPKMWAEIESAEQHGRHRVQTGMDIGGLTEEISLVGEMAVQLAEEDGQDFTSEEVSLLVRVIGHATAASARAYAETRNQELSRQASQHFSFIAHEIRNPLNNAQLAASLLQPASGQGAAHNLRRLERALAQLGELVDNALIGARLYAEPELSRERISAAELVEQARLDVEANADTRDINIATEVESFELDVDRKLMVSALTNLLSNAVKFSHPGADIKIRAHAEGDHSLLEVEDRCGGLPEDLPERLFQPFVQAGDDKSGFGLGLMIVKQAAEAHHGSVRVVNTPGVACCFIIDLPRDAGAESPAAPD